MYFAISFLNDPIELDFYCGKGEKKLITSVFFISHDVFDIVEVKFQVFSCIKFVILKWFQIGQVQNIEAWL